jgi:hypothetical protein
LVDVESEGVVAPLTEIYALSDTDPVSTVSDVLLLTEPETVRAVVSVFPVSVTVAFSGGLLPPMVNDDEPPSESDPDADPDSVDLTPVNRIVAFSALVVPPTSRSSDPDAVVAVR